MNLSDLPTSWEMVTLGEVLQLNYGKGLPKSKREKGRFSVYGSNGIVGSHSDFIVEQPCIVIGRKGSIGEINLSYQPSWPIDTTYFIDLFYGQPIKYWFFRLKALPLTKMNRASAIPGLNREDAYQQKIGLPPLNEQRRIVAKIEELTAHSRRARTALDEVPTLIEQFKQSVLAAAFRGDLTADWREKNPDVEPAGRLLERIRDERCRKWEEDELAKMQAKGKEPKNDKWKQRYKEPACNTDIFDLKHDFNIEKVGWAFAYLELLVDPKRGIPYGIVQTGENTEGGIPTVRCGDIKDYQIEVEKLKLVSQEIANKYERTSLCGNELLIAIRGTVGGVALVTQEMKNMNISREVAMIPLLPEMDREFVMYLLSSPISSQILSKHVRGVAQSGINLNDLRSFPVPLPCISEQREIVKRIKSFITVSNWQLGEVNDSLSKLKRLDQSILAKAFRGELVPQDPNDEPASVLLERIRAEREKLEAAKKKKKRSTRKKAK